MWAGIIPPEEYAAACRIGNIYYSKILRKENYHVGICSKRFSGVFTLILWLCLIACAIGGGIIGASMGGHYNNGHPIIGALVGLIIGLIIDVVSGGLVATFLNIDENIQKLVTQMNQGSYPHNTASNKVNPGTLSSLGSSGSLETKRCKNCGESVNTDVFTCPKCGGTSFVVPGEYTKRSGWGQGF
jgi:hypothetical protein